MERKAEIVVTGASGFVGSHLCVALQNGGYGLRRLSRNPPTLVAPSERWFRFDAIERSVGDRDGFVGADAVVHLAARAHVMHEKQGNALSEFRKANVLGAVRTAAIALDAGVKRFVYVSSIGVNGNATQGAAFTERDDVHPVDLYAISKQEAESELTSMLQNSKMELVIVRPPLVFGPGNPGNFLRLMQLVASGVPLPFGSVKNKKNFIYVENLSSALIECAVNNAAAGNVFLVADQPDFSTPELLSRIAHHMHRRSNTFSFPPLTLHTLGRITGTLSSIDKMTSSLAVDASKIRDLLGWVAPVAFDTGLERTVEWFLTDRGNT